MKAIIGKSAWMLLALQTLFISTAMAQGLKKCTLEDLIPGGETYRFADNLYGLQWWGDVCIKSDTDKLYAIDPRTGKEKAIATWDALPKPLYFSQVEMPFKQQQLLFALPTQYLVYDAKTKQIVSTLPIREEGKSKDYCAANQRVAYTIGNNLYVDSIAVTNEVEGIVCGQSVHRNEFGISKGTFWSPTGKLLAFYRMDERMVAQYPLVDVTTHIAQVDSVRYPMAGTTSHQVSVGIYNPLTASTVYLNTGNPTDRYFTNISWAPGEESLYLIELNRDQNHAKLCQYDAQTGELMNVIFEELSTTYVEPQHPITFLPWDASCFIVQSQRDGFNHLYLYNTVTKELKQITSGNWVVQALLGFNQATKEVIIASTECSPLQKNHYKVNLETKKRTLLGSSNGVHSGMLSPSGRYLIDTYTSPTAARNIEIIDTKTGKSTNLLRATNPFEGYALPTIETGTIKAGDETTDLYYRLTKPSSFDQNKKYPVIIYVYGGPHAQMVTNGWMNGANGWELYMAEKGYILFCLDNRGSDNRGVAFERATFRHLGVEEIKDQIKGVAFLQTLPYVDTNRMGVHGWSFGGHITTALMLRYPDLFKVGVAGGPVIDWGYYEIMYGERYMGTPQTNPDGYLQCNLNTLAGNLKGHLLLIHGDHDDTCVPQHTLSFIKACVDARTYPDLFIYPQHKHNVVGRDRVHLHQKITRYFEDNL